MVLIDPLTMSLKATFDDFKRSHVSQQTATQEKWAFKKSFSNFLIICGIPKRINQFPVRFANDL